MNTDSAHSGFQAGRPTAAGLTEHATGEARPRRALIQSLVLVALVIWAFRSEVAYAVRLAWHVVDWAHALVLPLAIVLLLYHRREVLARDWRQGSAWGVVVLVLAVASLALAIWPFSYMYIRVLQIIPALAGVILAVAGWRVLKRCMPVLLLVFCSIPVGQSIYATLSIRPETVTLDATRLALDQLPGVVVELEGTDLVYFKDGKVGTIAQGQPHRGASLLLAYLAIGVFVVFARIRPLWQVLVLSAAAIPIMLFCNLARLVTQGVVTIYAGASPTSAMPRNVGAVVSLLAAYVIFALGGLVLSRLLVEDEPAGAHAPVAEGQADA